MRATASRPAVLAQEVGIPALFVVLWSTGFIGAKLGLPYAGPLTFLTLHYWLAAALLALVARASRCAGVDPRMEWRAGGRLERPGSATDLRRPVRGRRWSLPKVRIEPIGGALRPGRPAQPASPNLIPKKGCGLAPEDVAMGPPGAAAAVNHTVRLPRWAQGGIVFRPVGDPVPLPGDAVAASGVGLERHRRKSEGHGRGCSPTRPSSSAPPEPIRATR
jgi:hypothetical protein